MDLEEMRREIEALVVAKGFYNSREDVSKKLLFAFRVERFKCLIYPTLYRFLLRLKNSII